jgi:hypothetical protein
MRAIMVRTRTCDVKALVEATPISGPRVDVDPRVGLAGDRAPHHVADPEHDGAFALRLAQRPEGVGGLARLADDEHDVLGIDDRAPVPELGGILHLGRYPGQLLYQVLPDEGRVPGGAAGGDDDAAGVLQVVDVGEEPVEAGGPLLVVEPSPHGVPEGVRLLEDLLEHEVVEPVLLDHVQAEGYLLDLFRDLFV